MRISDWSSDVCSSDLWDSPAPALRAKRRRIYDGRPPPHRRPPPWPAPARRPPARRNRPRSEERREGKSVSIRVDPGGRRIIKKNTTDEIQDYNAQIR